LAACNAELSFVEAAVDKGDLAREAETFHAAHQELRRVAVLGENDDGGEPLAGEGEQRLQGVGKLPNSLLFRDIWFAGADR
jgi:hypothetical protein